MTLPGRNGPIVVEASAIKQVSRHREKKRCWVHHDGLVREVALTYDECAALVSAAKLEDALS